MRLIAKPNPMNPDETEIHNEYELVCHVSNGDQRYIDLFVAAPELLEAAESVIDDLERFLRTQGPGPDRRTYRLKQAILKARGGAR